MFMCTIFLHITKTVKDVLQKIEPLLQLFQTPLAIHEDSIDSLYMRQFTHDGKNGIFFGALLWPSGLIFQLFWTVLKRFCPLDSKNVFVLVLAHEEPELEPFEVDDIGDDGDDD